ncbi:precorrin-2 dehydrogenase/sirohydrochlorin ferrochelatase family protein [Sphingobacterium faecale]|uniref:precorrin-2 dehydrogenase n=1 Tax=Sphingobacterium faecale TaxID=2803775 RepID=A0ABS1R1L0_9SPHI|nr:bifunctional precorrin-2 dehydrogenase/sirohydrochlorin ferrochelatase [Sphingobacterium faecale]MBL1408360.1 bifunctional precorrin-2 dehydrogenase/sirohydrochlorin ferrochelatase [Sphingobacterium faecale]
MNRLFPIFLKLEQLQVLLIGAGPVGLEKISALLQQSPKAKVRVVAKDVSGDFRAFVQGQEHVDLCERSFEDVDLDGVDLVVVASNNTLLNQHIQGLARKRNVLLNVADKPDLCDFYLGSVVMKGDLKIGISTNGKSPTIAKRLKEFLQGLLPEEIDETLGLMYEMREQLRGDFGEKVRLLNAHTRELLERSQK